MFNTLFAGQYNISNSTPNFTKKPNFFSSVYTLYCNIKIDCFK